LFYLYHLCSVQNVYLLMFSERKTMPLPIFQAIPARVRPPFFIHRSFALLWLGQTVSEFGSFVTGSALQLLAVLLLNASPIQMGLLAFFGSLPVLAFGLFAGLWVDRLPRRAVMIVADLSRALLLLSVPLAALMGWLHITQLYLVVMLLNLLTLCFSVAQRSFLPSLISREQLVEGNSKLSASSALAEIGGPTLAGLLVQLVSAPFALIVDACSFLFSAFCLLLIRRQKGNTTPIEEATESFTSDFLAGLRLLLSHPVLRTLARAALMRNFFGGAFAALYTLYVIRTLHVSPLSYGVLVTLGGVGALFGSLLTRRVLRRWGLARTLLYTSVLNALMVLLTPLAGGPFLLAFLCLACSQVLSDSCNVIYEINELSLRQKLVPEQMQGRVHACMHVLANGVGPLGALLAGWLSLLIGQHAVLWLGALGMLLSALSLLFSPLRRL
jgi:predicted MFS family arabinose efflux permease